MLEPPDTARVGTTPSGFENASFGLMSGLFALAVNPPTRVPRVLNGFAFWNALLFVLLAVNYGLPLSQFLFFKQNPTPAFSVGVTEYKEK